MNESANFSNSISMGLLLDTNKEKNIYYYIYAQQHNVNPDNAQHCNDMQ